MNLRLAPILLLAAAFGCQRAPEPATANPLQRGPRAVIEALVSARQRGDYQEIESLVVAEHRTEVTATLTAVDGFLEANRELCAQVRRQFSQAIAESIDQSYFSQNLDVFSPGIRFLDETLHGDTAEVAFQIGDRLPIRRTRLVRDEQHWHYDPGPGFDPELPRAFADLAAGLRQVRRDLEQGRLNEEEIRSDPARLAEEVRLRLAPGVKRLPAAPKSTQSSPRP